MATVTATPPATPPVVESTAKHFLKSKRFWGAMTGLVALAAKVVQSGTIGPDDMAALMGILVALYGGIVAQGPLTASTTPPPQS